VGRGSGGLRMGMVGMLNLVFELLRTGLLAVVVAVVVGGLAQGVIGVSGCGSVLLGRIAVLGLLLLLVWVWG